MPPIIIRHKARSASNHVGVLSSDCIEETGCCVLLTDVTGIFVAALTGTAGLGTDLCAALFNLACCRDSSWALREVLVLLTLPERDVRIRCSRSFLICSNCDSFHSKNKRPDVNPQFMIVRPSSVNTQSLLS